MPSCLKVTGTVDEEALPHNEAYQVLLSAQRNAMRRGTGQWLCATTAHRVRHPSLIAAPFPPAAAATTPAMGTNSLSESIPPPFFPFFSYPFHSPRHVANTRRPATATRTQKWCRYVICHPFFKKEFLPHPSPVLELRNGHAKGRREKMHPLSPPLARTWPALAAQVCPSLTFSFS